jgi:hypothetical protein
MYLIPQFQAAKVLLRFNHIITGNGSLLSGMLGKACTNSKLTPACLAELLLPGPGVGPAAPLPGLM